jgi:hypothetical protein
MRDTVPHASHKNHSSAITSVFSELFAPIFAIRFFPKEEETVFPLSSSFAVTEKLLSFVFLKK